MIEPELYLSTGSSTFFSAGFQARGRLETLLHREAELPTGTWKQHLEGLAVSPDIELIFVNCDAP